MLTLIRALHQMLYERTLIWFLPQKVTVWIASPPHTWGWRGSSETTLVCSVGNTLGAEAICQCKEWPFPTTIQPVNWEVLLLLVVSLQMAAVLSSAQPTLLSFTSELQNGGLGDREKAAEISSHDKPLQQGTQAHPCPTHQPCTAPGNPFSAHQKSWALMGDAVQEHSRR